MIGTHPRSAYRSLLALALTLAPLARALADPVTNVFTYQGELKTGGSPANGAYDMRFRLYDAATIGNQISGMEVHDGVSNPVIPVVDGLFAVKLDFGSVFNGTALWLEIDVRPDGPTAYTTLQPRQPLCATPYASYALASASAVNADTLDGQHGSFYQNAANLTGGFLPSGRLSGTYGLVVTLSNTANNITGTFTGNGAGLNSLNASNIASGTLGADRLPTGGNWNLTSNLTFDGALLTLDQSFGRVGIGTTSPNAALHIQSLTNITPANYNSRLAPVAIGDGDGTGDALLIDGDQIESAGDGSLSIHRESGGDVLFCTGGGSVAIGNPTPVVGKLHVANNSLSEPALNVFNDNGPAAVISGSAGTSLTVAGFTGTCIDVNSSGGTSDVGINVGMNGSGTALILRRNTSGTADLASFRTGTAGAPVVRARIDANGKGVFTGGVEFADGSVQTTAVPEIIAHSQSIDPPSLVPGANSTISVTIAGAALGDVVVVNPGSSLGLSYTIAWARVDAADSVLVGVNNTGTTTTNPGSSTWRFRIIK